MADRLTLRVVLSAPAEGGPDPLAAPGIDLVPLLFRHKRIENPAFPFVSRAQNTDRPSICQDVKPYGQATEI